MKKMCKNCKNYAIDENLEGTGECMVDGYPLLEISEPCENYEESGEYK